MFTLADLPAVEVQFDRHANLLSGADDLQNLADTGVTDLVVLCHGWNNDMAEARAHYEELAGSLRASLASVDGMADRRIGLVCLLWPSKRFTESKLIPGGAAAVASAGNEDVIRQQIDELREVFPSTEDEAKLDEMAGLVAALTDDPEAQARFADLARQLVNDGTAEPDEVSRSFFEMEGGALMTELSNPITIVPPDRGEQGAARLGDAANIAGDNTAGTAAGFGQVLGGVLGAARNLLNYTTYYRMKSRAGEIGEKGLAPLLGAVRRPGIRLHLVGHSFGGRLVTAAARALPPAVPSPVDSLTLLQAAFSHHGFSANTGRGRPGYFLPVIDNRTVGGPMLITHTGNDIAVGIMYAIASRIAGQDAAALGDANDEFGGIGRNGAQRTAGVVTGALLPIGDAYAWQQGKLHNLRADEFISGHSDVKGREVGYAIVSAIASTGTP
jgi:hypothetical protein